MVDKTKLDKRNGISSTLPDLTLAPWKAAIAALGTTRLLTSGTLKQMHSAQTVIPLEGIWAKFNPEAHLMSYGLGWMTHDYRGKKVVEHGGGIDGMRSQTGLMPELGLGVVVLTNRGRTMLPTAIMNEVFDKSGRLFRPP